MKIKPCGRKENEMNIIERLKQNEKPFGLMDAELQDKAKEIEPNQFEYYSSSGWGGNRSLFDVFLTYRLKSSYQEKPEFIEVEIVTGDNYRTLKGQGGSYIHAPAVPRITGKDVEFVGYKTKELDYLIAQPFAYYYIDGEGHPLVTEYQYSNEYKPLTYTHAVYQQKGDL